MEKYHIGQEILKEVKAKYPSVTAFAKDLCKSISATYEIFGKTSLDTDLLLKISQLLEKDFFREFSEKCLNGEVIVEDKEMTVNHLNCLLPEDELHVFTHDKHEMVLEEYFLLPRKKPLVAFCGQSNRDKEACIKLTCVIGENIFGEGMVRPLRVDSKNLADLGAQIPILTSIPQKAFVILYNGGGLENGYDHVILLAEKLLAASGKHVVLICNNRNWINQYSLEYISYVEPAFATWKQRIFACVLDNMESDFVYNRELYNAIKGCGYIDAIRHCLGLSRFDIDEEKVKLLIAEAQEKLSTFKNTIIKEDEERERHLISSLDIRPEDMEKFKRHMSKNAVSIWIDVYKNTGEIRDFQGSLESMILGD